MSAPKKIGCLLAVSILTLIATASAQTPPPEEGVTCQQLLQQAADLKSQMRWDEALDVLRQVVARRQEDAASAAAAQCRMGEYRLQMAMPIEAEAELERVELDFPQETAAINWSRLALIDAFRLQDRRADAENEARTLLGDSARTPLQEAWCRVKLADLLREGGRTDEALEILGGLDEITLPAGDVQPKVEGSLTRGTVLVERNQFTAAIPVLEQAVIDGHEPYPSTANWVRVRLAQALVSAGRTSEAVTVADATVTDHAAGKATDQQVANALLWKGRALKAMSQFSQGGEAFQMALAVLGDQHPQLAYETLFALGENCREHAAWAAGQGLETGALRVEALSYYQAALQKAQAATLSPDRQDWARLQVGSQIRDLGNRDQGIAYLRVGIEDPAHLSPTDQVLAQRIGSFMNPLEKESWQKYLTNPVGYADPTVDLVQRELGVQPASASSIILSDLFERHYWLARLYENQKRLDEALSTYQYVQGLSSRSGDQAQAMAGQSRMHYAIGQKYRARGQMTEYNQHWGEALSIAQQAVDLWLQEALTTENTGDAHYAIEQAVTVYRTLGLKRQALRTADQFVSSFAGGPPAREAFALYMQSRALAWDQRYFQAANAALALDRTYEAYSDAAIQEIRVAGLVRASAFYAWSGDRAAGAALLERIAARYPGQYEAWMKPYRRLCGLTPLR